MAIFTARQEARMNMYMTVRDICEANPTAVSTIKAFSNSVIEFKAFIPLLESTGQRAGRQITGIAADKSISKTTLSQKAARIANSIFAYAAKIGNETLKQSVDFSYTDLRDLKDAEIALQVQNIHDAGAKVVAELADYGVTEAKLADLQTIIDGYKAQVAKPRDAIVERAANKTQVKQLFKQADAILVEQMDRLVQDLAEDFPDFVNAYKSARVIVDPPTKTKKPKPAKLIEDEEKQT